MFAPDTICSKLCRMKGKKGTRTMYMGIKPQNNKHPKRNPCMVTKCSKKEAREKWGESKKPKNKTKYKRNKSPKRGYIIVKWHKQWHIRTMGMSKKPQTISVIV